MKFSGLTKKGRAYLAKCQASSTPIQFTKMKFGDGKLIDNENPADLLDIKNIKVEKSILSKEQKGDAIVLTTVIDNVSLEEGYFPRETGIYVLDEGVEVLYFYMNDGDETSWIPPEADGPHRMEVKINLISSNTGSVVVHNDGKDLYITKEYLEANYTQNGGYKGTAREIDDRVVAAVGQLNGMFPLSEATAGNIYYHQGNKKFYICKSNYNGTTISVPNMNFEELSIWENRKRLENLFNFNLIKTSQNKGYKFYVKNSYTGNYIDVSDTFSSIDFCLLSPTRSELSDLEARFINYQGFDGRNILINAIWLNGNSLEKKYSSVASNSLLTASCIAFVYGTLK